ncbi:MAG: TM0106 family RecB-like putative nuclease, partial [Candidatus Helarchaeota archaeon]|nr:TM0106 family RecB-like putative nuclease [Candidatus Helarchaeota archaeon]
MMKINNELFLNYLHCKYKSYLIFIGEIGEKTENELMMSRLQKNYKPIAENALLNHLKYSSVPQKLYLTRSNLKKGYPLIFNSFVKGNINSFHFDALLKTSEKSSLGTFSYIPILFHLEDTISEINKLFLAFEGFLLGNMQEYQPNIGKIIYGKNCRSITIKLKQYEFKVNQIVDNLGELINNISEPKLILNKHCQFRKRCKNEALKKDDLSLLQGMNENIINKFNNKGIFTVNQLSYTFRPRKRNKRIKAQNMPFYFSLQALALREQRIYVFQKPNLPITKTHVFIDMEGNSNGSMVYLIGMIVVENGKSKSYTFWANTKNEEKDIFVQFLQILASLKDAFIFYYGSYETRVFKRMVLLTPTIEVKDLLQKRSVNILSAIYSNLYFPTYSNELKDIGKNLGYIWSDPNSCGIQSIVWRKQWENTNDNALRSKLIKYNHEDCLALRNITEFIYSISDNNIYEATYSRPLDIALVEEIKSSEEMPEFGRVKFATKDFDYINKCAYFDYQRDKIFVRTNNNLRRAKKHKKKLKIKFKINKKIMFKAYKCPRCESKRIFRDKNQVKSKLSIDLQISQFGIKSWITKFSYAYHLCSFCKNSFVPQNYTKQIKFGHRLIAWAMYQHIKNRISFENLERTSHDCFGLPVNFNQFYWIKSYAVEYYKPTYNKILKKIITGPIIHADETKIKLQQDSGFVWVFTNMEEVVYLYRPNRKTEFLHELLKDFKGVLITDFYTGYDSLECIQQKCIVHLIRDLNYDLYKNPFDNELKMLGTMFGSLMGNTVSTIDRFGLKSRYMRKHKK